VPNEPFAALVRTVKVENLKPQAAALEVLDGLPKVVPYGEAALFLQKMPFITEAYLRVQNLPGRVPFINLKAKPSDSPETEFVHAGNFFLGFDAQRGPLLPAIVDPALVFGEGTDLARPYAFLGAQPFDAGAVQARHCLTPCAFLFRRFRLPGRGVRRLVCVYGCAPSVRAARQVARKIRAAGYLERKAGENRLEIGRVMHRAFLHCGCEELNQYLPRTFLDNVLRGGLPITVPAGRRPFIFHVYSRRHGDLERDYNFFQLAPTFFSQGNGAFRDVNQNRRCDVWFSPEVQAENLRYFFNLVQPDGYNPLLCRGARFQVTDRRGLAELLRRALAPAGRQPVKDFLGRPFAPGELFRFLSDQGLHSRLPRERFLEEILSLCRKREDAEYEAGYWTDHWYHGLDHLESFLAIFPDRLREVLIRPGEFTFYDPVMRVAPRDERYVLRRPGEVRQLDPPAPDPDKARLIAARRSDAHLVRSGHGRGGICRTSLLGKLICVVTNKLATISPSGVGLEMEGGRPGWHDSINGLPGQFGATTPETFQLLRAIRLVLGAARRLGWQDRQRFGLPAELANFVGELSAVLRRYLRSRGPNRDYAYWDAANAAKEAYRDAVRFGFGADVAVRWGLLRRFLGDGQARILASLPKARDPRTGLYSTYFTHAAVKYKVLSVRDPATGRRAPKLSRRGLPCVRVKRFKAHRFPLFLEAPAHALRLENDPRRARRVWRAVRASPLYDRKLRMYRLSDSVAGETPELGRIWAWPPGWFENENVFLHMEHKYLLGLLHAGLYDEFFEDLRRCLIPFQHPRVLGRNPYENASFIVSSRHPRAELHGRAFLPRCSGTTAEVLNMFLWMSFGKQPFVWQDGKLSLRLSPVLPAWLFTRRAQERELVRWDGQTEKLSLPAGSYSALFLGHTLVTYLNPQRRNTYGPKAVRPVRYELVYRNGRRAILAGSELAARPALDVREGKVSSLRVLLGQAARPGR
jgi:hypothetical protein